MVEPPPGDLRPLTAGLEAEGMRAVTGGTDTHLALLDLRMPGPSGLDLQSALQRQGHEIPIIFLTAHGDVPAARTASSSSFRQLAQPGP